MPAKYAKDQPSGYKNYIENVAIVGAGGQVGKFITEALLKEGKHKVTAITRIGSTAKIPEGTQVKKVDYNDHNSLVAALKGQDALIITMAVTAPPDTQNKLVQAAAEAGVPWILPNEFGTDGTNEKLNVDTGLGLPKKAVREAIEAAGSSWIGISCGFWYEFSLAGTEDRYGFDLKKRTAIFYDDGLRRLPTTTWPQTGLAVARLLGLKLLPENEADKSPTVEDYRNRFVFVESFNINQQEMLESILRVTGDKKSDWKITQEPVQARYKNAVEQLQKTGDMKYFGQMLYSRLFFPDTNSTLKHGTENEKLGLPKEDLDEFTKVALDMDKAGYFDNIYGA